MNWFKTILSKFGYYNMNDFVNYTKEAFEDTGDDSTKVVVTGDEDKEYGYKKRKTTITYAEMYEFYKKNEWIRASVDVISGVASRAKLVVKAKDKDKEVTAEVKQHIEDVEALIDNPNERDETFGDIRKKIIRDILIYDAAAMEIVYDSDRKPYELYDVSGQLIRLNINKHGYFRDKDKAYMQIQYSAWGMQKAPVEFSYDEVMYWAMNVNSGEVYGLSPLETLVDSINADNKAAEYNAAFFDNNALTSGILSIPGLEEKKLKVFSKTWFKRAKGSKNAHKLAIVNNQGVDFKNMTATARDMQFIEYQKWILNKIMAIYKVNPFVLGLVDESTGKLNSHEQWTTFIEKAIHPILKAEQYLYNTKLVRIGFGYNDVEVEFEDLTAAEEQETAELVDKIAKTNVKTLNEMREEYYGLDPVPWGNVPYDALKAGITELGKTEEEKTEKALITEEDRETEEIKQVAETSEGLTVEDKPELEENDALSLKAKILNIIHSSIKEKAE